MIFFTARIENLVQVDDFTLIDLSATTSTEEITLFEIKPEADWFDVTNTKSLGWAFGTDGTKTISARATTASETITKTYDIEVISKENDLLFSSDSDLCAHESDILKYLPDNRKTYLDAHRVAQKIILDILDHKQIYKLDGSKLLKTDIADIDEVNQWSKYLTLSIIFENLSNQVDDIFSVKAKKYSDKASFYSDRSQLRLKTSTNEVVNYSLSSGTLSRR